MADDLRASPPFSVESIEASKTRRDKTERQTRSTKTIPL
jgi:hypothetical protein